MDKDNIVAEFKRELCRFFGYDQDLKFTGTGASAPQAKQVKASLEPRDFLNFAVEDSTGLENERNRINCLGNCKRAIDSQVDCLIRRLGFLPLSRREHWNIPRKIKFISASGIVVPRILQSVNQVRNQLEHEFVSPSKRQVEDALDVVMLFISYAELVKIPTMNWTLSSKLSVRYDYEEMVFLFYDNDPSIPPEPEPSPKYSLGYGEHGFQEFYDFLEKIVPLMQKQNL